MSNNKDVDKKYSTRDYLSTPRTVYFRIIIIKIEMTSISEGTGMSDFRDQEVQEVFTKCDPNNVRITITCCVFEKCRFPRTAESETSACDQEICIFHKLTMPFFKI